MECAINSETRGILIQDHYNLIQIFRGNIYRYSSTYISFNITWFTFTKKDIFELYRPKSNFAFPNSWTANPQGTPKPH